MFSKLRAVFGGRVRFFVTGAAPIAPEILEFFWAAGFPIFEVYGMTEAYQIDVRAPQSIGQIGEIAKVIAVVNDVVATIASAVEEQSAATKDIATNVAQASRGIQEVNENVNQSSTVSGEISQDIAGVSVSMNEMSTSSSQVNLSAQELSQLSENLKQMVDQFNI